MSEPIRVGDLVMVVRGHECSMRSHGGHIYTVLAIHAPTGGGWRCEECGARSLAPNEFGAQLLARYHGVPLSWLRKIDPLSAPESITTDEGVTA